MRAARLVPLAGVVAVVLVVVAAAVGGETPDGNDSIRKIVSFYRDNDTEQVVAGALLAWAAAFFLIFLSGLWRVLRNAEAQRGGASALALAGGVLFAAGLTVFAGISFTLGDLGDDLGPGALQALNALSSDLFFPVAVGNFAFLVGSGAAVVATGALPKWIGWVAVVLGIASATPVGFFALLVTGVWILVVSVLLAQRGPTPARAAP